MGKAPPTDSEIVAASLAEARAFEVIFDRHFLTISRYLRRRLAYAIADELTAEVFTAAFAARRSYDLAHPDALPWLYGIAANLIRRHSRKEQAELRAHERTMLGPAVPAVDPLDEILCRVVEPALAQALAELDPRDREVLLLFAWANLGYDEIARALDLPLGTVKSRLNRARVLLRASLRGVSVGQAEAVNG